MLLLAAAPSRAAAQLSRGQVVWHDLVTQDLEISKTFYSELFGWTWRAPTSGKGITYVVGEKAGVAMAGIAESEGKVNASQWITYFAADNVGGMVRAAVDSGAELVVAPTRTGSWYDETALLTDPQGAPFALMKPGTRPSDSEVPINGWLWVELWTTDPVAAAAFYGKLFGYEQRIVMVGGMEYTLLQHDSMPRMGMLKIPVNDVRPNWLPTIRVADVDAMVRQVVSLGGRVILAPRPEIRKGTVAIIADPTGAALALQQWEGTSSGVATQ